MHLFLALYSAAALYGMNLTKHQRHFEAPEVSGQAGR